MSTLNISYREEWNNDFAGLQSTVSQSHLRVRNMNIKATKTSVRKVDKAEEYLEERTHYAKYTGTGQAQRHNSAPEYLVLFG